MAALLVAALVGPKADCWVALRAVWWAGLLVVALVDWMAASKVASLAAQMAARLVAESDLPTVASLAVSWDPRMD